LFEYQSGQLDWFERFPVCLPAVSTDKAKLKLRAITVQARGAKAGQGLLCISMKPVLFWRVTGSPATTCGKSGEHKQGGCHEQ
jgi:hypothetical protein